MENSKQFKWIIDTDYSFDDQMAIAYLMDKIEILCITITSVYTGVSSTQIKAKVERDLLEKYKKEIPVYAGCDQPFVDYVEDYGDLELNDPYNLVKTVYDDLVPKELNKNNIRDKLSNTASVKIIENLRKYKDDVKILCLGPLTNISLAILVDASITNCAYNIYIAGGSLNNKGNSGLPAEYNFRADPIAARSVITHMKHIKLYPIEIELQIVDQIIDVINLTEEKKEIVLSNYIQMAKEAMRDADVKYSFFALIVAVLIINPDLVKVTKVRPCDVDIIGRFTKGVLAIEKYEHMKSNTLPEITLIEELNIKQAIEIFNDII